jgi:hypothetical protein
MNPLASGGAPPAGRFEPWEAYAPARSSAPRPLSSLRSKLSAKQLGGLLLLAAGAMLVHGYHPFVEDGEIYVPAIKQQFNPALYPYNSGFFSAHAHLTLFPNLIAASLRITHLPLEWGLMVWQLLSIFFLLLACWRLGRLTFRDPQAAWGSAALVASLLTIPVAGTSLYIMDQYLTTRSLSAPAVIFILVNALEGKLGRSALWAIFAVLIHPLMAVFGLSYAVLVLGMSRNWRGGSESSSRTPAASLSLLVPFAWFPPVTDAYREVLRTRSYFFLLRWAWYEWLGLVAPLGLLWWFERKARQQRLPVLALLCRALLGFAAFYFALSVAISVPPGMARFAELQPLRFLHLLYILLFVFAGGWLAQWAGPRQVGRWLVLLVPLCAGMAFAARQLFPATPHLEWPNASSSNDWVQAFVWIREHTPLDAYFALDPNAMALAGEDQHGFRALAERSRLADRIKDSGAVTMFPALAEFWRDQVRAQDGWQSFQLEDFRRLKREFGVDWIVVERPGIAGMDCPYRNRTLSVCRVN